MNRNKKASKIGTVAAVLASVILSGTTVFAYTPMQTIESDNIVINKQESLDFAFSQNLGNAFSEYDIYFQSNDDTIIPADENDIEPRAIFCSHNFKTGYVNRHTPKDDGGCIVRQYTGKICTKCNHIVIGELLSTTTYTKCPH